MNEIKIIDTRKTGSRRIVAEGDNLKEACLNWYQSQANDTKGFFNDYLFDDYVELTGDFGHFGETDEEFENRYDRYLDWLHDQTGEYLFELLRDGNYHYWEDWKEEDIEEEED